MRQYTLSSLILCCGALFCTSLLAADMTLHGTLVEPPPCTINDGNIVDVDFGSALGVNSIDGVQHRQNVDYQLVCDVNSPVDGLVLVLSGLPTDFDTAAVKSSVTGLGIRLFIDGEPARLGKAIPVTPDSPPKIEAVPVKDANVNLNEGAFEAAATLSAEYQ